MLLQFTVGNYRSFRERVTFSLMAEPREPGHENSLIAIAEDGSDTKALSLAALYGANASGKSNLLKAIDFLRRLVVEGTRPGQPIPVDRFLLNGKHETTPSFFEIYFSWNGKVYSYGIECDVRTIHHEWLRLGTDERLLFTRRTEGNKVTVEIGDELKEQEQIVDARWHFIADGTRPNQPYLTQATEQHVTSLRYFHSWFQDHLFILGPKTVLLHALMNMEQYQDYVKGLGRFLRAADTGIEQVKLLVESFDLAQLPDDLRRQIESLVLDEDIDSYIDFYWEDDRATIKWNAKERKTDRIKLQAFHYGSDGRSVPIDWSSESDGTRRMAQLWQMIFMHPFKGSTHFVDEIERSLHPELMRLIIEQWREVARPNCQLIFTTHNDNFLEDDLLRRDEVWFIEKDRTGGTRMTSETEFKPIEGVTRQRAYIDGMYGGTPRIASRRFHWVDRKEKP